MWVTEGGGAKEMSHTVPVCRARKQREASRGQTSARVGASRRVLGRCGVDETGEMLTCEVGKCVSRRVGTRKCVAPGIKLRCVTYVHTRND